MDQQQGQRPERARNRAWLQNNDGAGFTTDEAKLAVLQDIRDALLDIVSAQRHQTLALQQLAETSILPFRKENIFQRSWWAIRNRVVNIGYNIGSALRNATARR